MIRGFQHAVCLERDITTNKVDDTCWYTDAPLIYAGRWDWFAFRAPELDNNSRHGTAVDIWSLGACLSMMLTGLPPFRGRHSTLRQNKQLGRLADYDIVMPSPTAQNLVRQMLSVDPAQRPSIKQVLDHEWMQQSDPNENNGFEVDLSLAQVFLQDWEQQT